MINNNFKCKTLALDISDIDPATRKVVGYFSTFDVKDSDNDVIRKGAYANSIAQKGVYSNSNRKIAHLWNHNWDEPIGKLLELEEDDLGLRFVSQLGRSQKGQDTFLNYQDGIIREHSVGFYYLESGVQVAQDSEFGIYNNITNVDLFEGSSVTFGSNAFTPVLDVTKGMKVEDVIESLNKQMLGYIDALKNGAGTDERLYQIEMGLRVLQSTYYDLLKRSLEDTEPSQLESVEENSLETPEDEQLVIKSAQNFKKIITTYLKPI